MPFGDTTNAGMDMQVVCLTKLKLSPTLVVVLLVSFTVVIAAGKGIQ